jgi:hypothetical protein
MAKGRGEWVSVRLYDGLKRLKVDESGVALIESRRTTRLRWSEVARVAVPEEARTIHEHTVIEFIPVDPGRAPVTATLSPSSVPPGEERTQFVAAVNRWAEALGIPSSLTEEKIAGRPSSPRAAAEGPRKSPAIKGVLGDYVALVAAAQPDPPRRFDRGKVIRISARETLPGPLTLDMVGTFWVFWMLIAGSSPDYEVLSAAGLGFMILAALGGTLLALSVIQLKYARATRALAGGVLVVDEGSEDAPPATTLVHPASGRLLVRLPAREAERT